MKIRSLVVLALVSMAAACGSSSSPTSPSSSPSSTTTGSPISIVSGATSLTTTAYAPNPISVAVGGTVTWRNNDTTTHTATDDGGAWDSGSIAPGASFSRTFTAAGSFKYHCTLHPGMIGTVTVQ